MKNKVCINFTNSAWRLGLIALLRIRDAIVCALLWVCAILNREKKYELHDPSSPLLVQANWALQEIHANHVISIRFFFLRESIYNFLSHINLSFFFIKWSITMTLKTFLSLTCIQNRFTTNRAINTMNISIYHRDVTFIIVFLKWNIVQCSQPDRSLSLLTF